MSDLYYETSGPGSAAAPSARESGHDTAGRQNEAAGPAPGRGHESPERTDNSREYEETQAGTEARIAAQDELPSPEQSYAATWGDDPGYYDEADLASEYDGDLAALLAAEDDLPAPQEEHARTWGDNPGYHDEADPSPQDGRDPATLTTGEQGPAAWLAPERPDAQDAGAEPPLPEATVGTDAQDAGNRDEDAVSTTGRQPDQPETDLADQPELPGPDADTPLSPEGERVKALEAELGEARQKIAELQAKNDEPAASADRIEQQPTSSESLLLPENQNPRDEVADANDSTAAHSRLRRAVSADTFGAAATLIDASDTIRLVAMHATPGEVVIGLTATALGLVSLGLAKVEQHRKGKK